MLFRYCIRTCPQRKELCDDLYQKLRDHLPPDIQIDIVEDTIGLAPIKIFADYLDNLLKNKVSFDHLVTLEDDAIFNKNLHVNLLNFDMFHNPKLGCVQLSLASLMDMVSPFTLYSYDLDAYFRTQKLHYSCGLTFSRQFLEALDLGKWRNKLGPGFDVSMTEACLTKNFLYILHFPALIATKPNTESTLNNEYKPIDDLYSETWESSTKDSEDLRWQGVEKLYGFKKKSGDHENNPQEMSDFYLKYLQKEVFEKGQIIGKWSRNT